MLINPGVRVKVEVPLKDPPLTFYSTIRHCDDHSIEILAPVINGKKIAVPVNTNIAISHPSTGGLLRVDSVVVEVRTVPLAVWVVAVPPLEHIHKIQRRADKRYEIDLHLRWRKYPETGPYEVTSLKIADVSREGARISLEIALNIGDMISIDLTPLIQISGQLMDRRTHVRAKVVRQIGKEGFVYGVRFESLGRVEKNALQEALKRIKAKTV